MRARKHGRPRRPATPTPPPKDQAADETAPGPQEAAPETEAPEETVPEDDEDQADDADQEEPAEDGVPWYSVRNPGAPDPDGPQTWTVAPGVQITVPAPQPATEPSYASVRRQRIRRWLVRHAAAAGVGWTFGLYQSMSAFLNGLGHGGAAAGLALAGFGWWGSELVTDRLGRAPFVPQRTLPALHWLTRVPFATALLVTCLYAPQAHL